MPAATLCNLPLSTTFDHNLEKSLSSLEWVLTSRVPAVSGPFSLPYCDGAVDTVFVSKYSCWLPPFFYLTLFLAVTGIIFVETREACVYLASGVLRFARCHEHLWRHTGGTFRMLMPRLLVTNRLFCFSPATDATPLCPAAASSKTTIPSNSPTSIKIPRDIFLGHRTIHEDDVRAPNEAAEAQEAFLSLFFIIRGGEVPRWIGSLLAVPNLHNRAEFGPHAALILPGSSYPTSILWQAQRGNANTAENISKTPRRISAPDKRRKLANDSKVYHIWTNCGSLTMGMALALPHQRNTRRRETTPLMMLQGL
ncbi:hypothetical protein B0H13DRAFT_1864964 [Mycena leptocephala]|nr:hypothetical protein B0H13DRAFT_1864964 [Mycena leptocephala]